MYNEFNYNVFAVKKRNSLCVFFLLLVKKRGYIMKKAAKLIAASLAVSALALAGCNKKSESSELKSDGKVLNICVWNNEFKDRFAKYFEAKGLVPDGVKVNWLLTPNLDNAYQNKLDELLLNQENVSDDEKVDIFLVEADYAKKYVDSGMVLDVEKEIGLTEDDLSRQYVYTKDVMTDKNGVLRGVSWQACPGGFIYRRSIAKAVLGTDEPSEVQKSLSNWDDFDSVAAKAKEKGYFMLSGFDDAFRVFSDNAKSKFVEDGKIKIDPQVRRWITQTKLYTDKGYNNKANLWSPESFQGASKNGKVFGYFGPAWFIDFSLAPATLEDSSKEKKAGNGSWGDWAFCNGPESFCWGGTWICGAKGSDNVKLIRDVMYQLTCDKETMKEIAMDTGDFVNNSDSMFEVASSGYKNEFLGGQNHIPLFLEAARNIHKDNMTAYDQGITENLMKAFADYFNGYVTEEKAWDNFYTSVIELYPNLSK